MARQAARSPAPRAVRCGVGARTPCWASGPKPPSVSQPRVRALPWSPALGRVFSLPRTAVLLLSTEGVRRLTRGPDLALCLFFAALKLSTVLIFSKVCKTKEEKNTRWRPHVVYKALNICPRAFYMKSMPAPSEGRLSEVRGRFRCSFFAVRHRPMCVSHRAGRLPPSGDPPQ